MKSCSVLRSTQQGYSDRQVEKVRSGIPPEGRWLAVDEVHMPPHPVEDTRELHRNVPETPPRNPRNSETQKPPTLEKTLKYPRQRKTLRPES